LFEQVARRVRHCYSSDYRSGKVPAGGAGGHLSTERVSGRIVLHGAFSNPDDTKSACLWAAETVDAVRNLVDSAVGQFSQNEYFEVSTETALGLPN
jgi:hypothetical protein